MKKKIQKSKLLIHVETALACELSEVLPQNTRKLYPFTYFTTFKNFDPNTNKPIRKLHCSYCNDDLSENGNGRYYSGYVVFESENEVKVSCCRSCNPAESMEYYDQQYGHREPVVFPPRFNKSFLHEAIFKVVMSGHLYAAKDYVNSVITQEKMKELFNISGSAGGSNSFCEYNWMRGKLYLTKNHMPKHVLTYNQVCHTIIDILKNQPVTDKTKAKQVQGICPDCNSFLIDAVPGTKQTCPNCEKITITVKAVKTQKLTKAITYPGGKNGAGTYQEIINQFPKHATYIEGCLGAGAILNKKKPAFSNTGIEIDGKVIAKHQYRESALIKQQDLFEYITEKRELLNFKTVLLYIDPPYPISTLKQDKALYENSWTDQQHEKLLKEIKHFECMIAISSYENKMYDEILTGWRKYTFTSQTRHGVRTECLYMNYPEPTELHEYTYLGKNFTDRQRIKRKIAREVNKLMALPILERKAIITHLKTLE